MAKMLLLEEEEIQRIIKDAVEATKTELLQCLSTQKKSSETWIGRKQAANLLQISLPTLWGLMRRGKIPYTKVGRRVLIKEEDLINFLEINSSKHGKEWENQDEIG